MSAESNRVRPASRQTSTRRVASATSVAPQALKNSLPPPKVPVPRLKTGTLNPEPPSCRYSMVFVPVLDATISVLHRVKVAEPGLRVLAGLPECRGRTRPTLFDLQVECYLD